MPSFDILQTGHVNADNRAVISPSINIFTLLLLHSFTATVFVFLLEMFVWSPSGHLLFLQQQLVVYEQDGGYGAVSP
jgi:hypothetical protein